LKDNENSIYLTTEHFKEISLTIFRTFVRTGEEAIKYLDRRAAVENQPNIA